MIIPEIQEAYGKKSIFFHIKIPQQMWDRRAEILHIRSHIANLQLMSYEITKFESCFFKIWNKIWMVLSGIFLTILPKNNNKSKKET